MKPSFRTLVAESSDFADQAQAVLSQLGPVRLADLDRPGVLRHVADCEVLWVRLRHSIDAEVMDAAPGLTAIISPTTGLNHIDLQEAQARGIRVFSLRGETDFLKDVRATAELTIGLMLSVLRHIPAADRSVQSGQWNRDLFKGGELCGKTVGLVGYGRLGRLVGRYLLAFGASVLATDPDPMSRIGSDDGITFVNMNELLSSSEMVSLHVNLKPHTEGMFSADQFAAMRPGSWFINTSRGELVDEQALLVALESGHLTGAALDVLCGEQSGEAVQSPLWQYGKTHDNLLITPHIGGCTRESMEKTEIFLANKAVAALTQTPVDTRLAMVQA